MKGKYIHDKEMTLEDTNKPEDEEEGKVVKKDAVVGVDDKVDVMKYDGKGVKKSKEVKPEKGKQFVNKKVLFNVDCD
ncbi:hypothetical protein NDU88_010937 [Pleurodeles waltl]|uniref:Uncharacterized protein n=1 Tax=Pleurodeles waltl TaxID=8319 RepID=A0AAV7S117_PLEWA|nr:hypothetical protein NDU88_010937 [Pleurodeles waltl]